MIVGNSLFGAVKLTKNTDLDKYGYSCYDIGFEAGFYFPWSDGSLGQNVVTFGVDNSSSVHVCNKKKIC